MSRISRLKQLREVRENFLTEEVILLIEEAVSLGERLRKLENKPKPKAKPLSKTIKKRKRFK